MLKLMEIVFFFKHFKDMKHQCDIANLHSQLFTSSSRINLKQNNIELIDTNKNLNIFLSKYLLENKELNLILNSGLKASKELQLCWIYDNVTYT